ncbi:DNA primase, partial [Phocaeicola dorei]
MRAKREIIKALTKNDFLMNIETAKQINLADYLHSL